MTDLKALVFDCDGVLADTERDGHRIAFNKAFKEENVGVEWDIDEYGRLLSIAGGKERMKYYFSNIAGESFSDEYIDKIHKRKTGIYMDMCEKGELPIRPGIRRIIKEAHDCGFILSVCSTSSRKSVISLMKAILGDEYFGWFEGGIFAGDIVRSKKPSPDIYNLMREKFGLSGDECFVVEDSRNGLLAAVGAGMNCIVTVSHYFATEDFKEAKIVVSSLGDPDLEDIEVYQKSPHISSKIGYITLDHLKQLASVR